jgi:hypothetical protein
MRRGNMPKIEVNDEQILSCLDQLSPSAKRAALAKLIGGMETLDRLVERNRAKIEAICRERGVEFSRLNEEEREGLVNQILHESR